MLLKKYSPMGKQHTALSPCPSLFRGWGVAGKGVETGSFGEVIKVLVIGF